MNKLINWWNSRRELSKKKAIEAFKSDYKVSEKNGKLYLIHQGYAFDVMPLSATAEEITAKLNEARRAALEFEGL